MLARGGEEQRVALPQDARFHAADDDAPAALLKINVLHRKSQGARRGCCGQLETVEHFQQCLALIPRHVFAARGDHVAVARGDRKNVRGRQTDGLQVFDNIFCHFLKTLGIKTGNVHFVDDDGHLPHADQVQ